MNSYIPRIINLEVIKRKSIFLFGPRQTGKSMLLSRLFPEAPNYNLLLSDQYLRLSREPQLMRKEVLYRAKTNPDDQTPIIIDEIQKLPILLGDVQWLIENTPFHFILTGSSARKLKRGAANLLGGRALEKHLFPLTTSELIEWDLGRLLNFGSIPSIYFSPEPFIDLKSYLGTYLKEEVSAEGLVRGIEIFSDFLDKSALLNGELLNYANLASDLGISAKTVKEYFHILEDTLIGQTLMPFTKTKKRKSIMTAKFYFFDVGVANVLADRKDISPKSKEYGQAFEHLVYTELRSYLSYGSDDRSLSFWRTVNGQEVDFLLGDEVAIEVKATTKILAKHLKGLQALSEDLTLKRKIIVSLVSSPQLQDDGIEVLPFEEFVKQLWAKRI